MESNDPVYIDANTLAELLEALKRLEVDGLDMTKRWWGFDDGSLNIEGSKIVICSNIYN